MYFVVMICLSEIRISCILCTIVKCLVRCNYFEQLRSYSWKDDVEEKALSPVVAQTSLEDIFTCMLVY